MCKIVVSMAAIMGLGLLLYILLGIFWGLGIGNGEDNGKKERSEGQPPIRRDYIGVCRAWG